MPDRFEIVGYTYRADTYCPPCTESLILDRFGYYLSTPSTTGGTDHARRTRHRKGPAKLTYAAEEMHRQLKRGPYSDEDFFRLQVTGNGKTKWVNINAAELAAIAELLTERD